MPEHIFSGIFLWDGVLFGSHLVFDVRKQELKLFNVLDCLVELFLVLFFVFGGYFMFDSLEKFQQSKKRLNQQVLVFYNKLTTGNDADFIPGVDKVSRLGLSKTSHILFEPRQYIPPSLLMRDPFSSHLSAKISHIQSLN